MTSVFSPSSHLASIRLRHQDLRFGERKAVHNRSLYQCAFVENLLLHLQATPFCHFFSHLLLMMENAARMRCPKSYRRGIQENSPWKSTKESSGRGRQQIHTYWRKYSPERIPRCWGEQGKTTGIESNKEKILFKCSIAQNGRTSSIHHLRGMCKSPRYHQGPQFQRKNAILLNCFLLAFPNAKYKDTQRDFKEER